MRSQLRNRKSNLGTEVIHMTKCADVNMRRHTCLTLMSLQPLFQHSSVVGPG